MFREKWHEDILPSIYTALTMFTILYAIRLEHSVVLTSFAASAFIVFTLPQTVTARPRNLVGGHIIGFVTGGLTTLLTGLNLPWFVPIALSLALSTFLMCLLDLHHPPANGTALAIALNGLTTSVIKSIGISLLILLVIDLIYRSRNNHHL